MGAEIRNAGSQDGSEVAQLFVLPLNRAASEPVKELRGFSKVPLKAGETRHVTFELRPDRDFRRYRAERSGLDVAPGEYEIQIGASSEDIRLRRTIRILDAGR